MIMNRIKTALLLGSLSGILMLLGHSFGGPHGVITALLIGMILNGLVYFFSDKLVLKLYGAQPLEQGSYPAIYEMVEELARHMRLPMPRLWIVKTPIANAFATGRNPQHASIAVTTGILSILEPHELRGVLAHEMSHIKNRDILVGTVAATLAAAIGFIADRLRHKAFWGSNKDQKSNPIALMVIATLIPLIASLIQLAISRSREYLADETGAHACHDPLALASALEKLHHNAQAKHFDHTAAHASTAHLFIVNSLNSSRLLTLISTHPPLEKRVQRLHALYEKNF